MPHYNDIIKNVTLSEFFNAIHKSFQEIDFSNFSEEKEG